MGSKVVEPFMSCTCGGAQYLSWWSPWSWSKRAPHLFQSSRSKASCKKQMVFTFFLFLGDHLPKLCCQGKTVTSDWVPDQDSYARVLNAVDEEEARKPPEQLGSAMGQCQLPWGKKIMKSMERYGVTFFPYTSQSPDLASWDFFYFPII